MEKIEPELLKTAAREAAKNAHAPYSRYPVGAALLTIDGKIYRGCNVEASSYGLTVCAERNAIAAAVVAGEKHFRAIGIFSPNGAPPCGACRQVIWDICGDIDVFLFDEYEKVQRLRSADLLPTPFDNNKLKDIDD
ncbi:MAG: cytidine deaminase [Candidatus Marinimicrobia bacterium]|jgi:cytidine deaminase|nr:cytidine deaminase [Candidatus Neomarinimicrobiota bacterium]MCK9483601.1 cytidine deaminase [Candidatus Neomarinimicrobiota bacterium]MCK9560955.1 cytidine deaminase [Candidatus Neomarinimicrobiota bacterium]MDD5061224.1 cytidine deaminase [Candidatus Neomarinimicrobiota bacterium]MDD5230970.1 cytidine deaminase [Candidatus Neomarinimicrobiota bacterium]